MGADTDISLIYDPPMHVRITCVRAAGAVLTNVPRVVVNHSPGGYEWGYSGFGPAELALNICEHALRFARHTGRRTQCYGGDCFADAFWMHSEFCSDWIAPAPMEGFTIAWGDALEWVGSWLQRNEVPPFDEEEE